MRITRYACIVSGIASIVYACRSLSMLERICACKQAETDDGQLSQLGRHIMRMTPILPLCIHMHRPGLRKLVPIV